MMLSELFSCRLKTTYINILATFLKIKSAFSVVNKTKPCNSMHDIIREQMNKSEDYAAMR